MSDNPLPPQEPQSDNQVPPISKEASNTEPKKSNLGLVIGGIVVLLIIIGLVILLFAQTSETTSKIRDVFLIFLALQTFIIGVVLIILVMQISMLINLMRNEIKPVIDSTQQTVNTLKGTATFLSENLTNPVIKSNSIFAAVRKFFQLLFPRRSR